ncbi:hypothetical protein OZK63_22910 [Streptomyces sp. UMAF16]|nr:hypothetical protein [Streptomyces sp. UMAF16]
MLDSPRGGGRRARPVPDRPDPLRDAGPPGGPEPAGPAAEARYGRVPLGRAFIGLSAGATHGEGDGR